MPFAERLIEKAGNSWRGYANAYAPVSSLRDALTRTLDWGQRKILDINLFTGYE